MNEVAAEVQTASSSTTNNQNSKIRVIIYDCDDKHKRRATLMAIFLRRHETIRYFFREDICEIYFMNNPLQPAEVRIRREDTKKTIQIWISKWFFKGYSFGYVMGLLCHELGVHPIPDSENVREVEDPDLNREWDTGYENHKLVPSKGLQRDHIFAVLPTCARYKIYIDIVLDMALELYSPRGGRRRFSAFFSSSDVADLFDSYLMDIASISSSGDRRDRGALSPCLTAAYYNFHAKELRKRMLHKEKWKCLINSVHIPEKTTFEVLAQYGGALGKILRYGIF